MISQDVRGDAWSDGLTRQRFLLGDLIVDPVRHRIARGAQQISLEPRVMELLIYLAERPLEIISKRELIDNVWRANVVDEAVHRAVSLLRAALGETPRESGIIETVPRRGYRLLVVPAAIPDPAAGLPKIGARWLAAAAIVAMVVLVPGMIHDVPVEPVAPNPSSVAEIANPPVGNPPKSAVVQGGGAGAPELNRRIVKAPEPAPATPVTTPHAEPVLHPAAAPPAPAPRAEPVGGAGLAPIAESNAAAVAPDL